jgi:hypothetical protein
MISSSSNGAVGLGRSQLQAGSGKVGILYSVSDPLLLEMLTREVAFRFWLGYAIMNADEISLGGRC